MRFFFSMKDLFLSFPLSNQCHALTTATSLGNLAYQVDDGKDVLKRREVLSKAIGIPLDRFVFVHQSHSDKILKVTTADLGKGKDSFESGMECDALYTYEKNVPLGVFHADCVPIFFVNEKVSLVGIIHAGFKGTMKHVAYKAISAVLKQEKLNIEDFKFYIGPYRQKDSFVMDESTRKAVIEFGFEKAIFDDKFDNGFANKLDLYDLGVKDSQISDCRLDTVTDDRLYSAYQKIPVGRLVSLIYLK